MADDSLYLMSPLEVAWGYLPGHVDTPIRVRDRRRRANPRLALESVLVGALQRPPCGVAFSGGRDSSLILAVATHVARREGLPEPIPITKVFPASSATDEHEWQSMVIRHLGVSDWQRIELRDELDLVGPLATDLLVECGGVVWPPAIHADIPMIEQVKGGTLIDGEGGDEVLGVEAHRIAPITSLVRSRRPLSQRRVRAALRAFKPARHRVGDVDEAVRRAGAMVWLRPAALDPLVAALQETQRREPLSYRESVRRVTTRRTNVMLALNQQLIAGRREVDVRSPLADRHVIDALADDGGRLGRGDRNAVLEMLAGDLLPRELLRRRSKALFNEVYMSEPSKQFVDAWSGDGLDDDLVDAERLHALWRSGDRNAITFALLQAAWLGNRDRTPDGHRRD